MGDFRWEQHGSRRSLQRSTLAFCAISAALLSAGPAAAQRRAPPSAQQPDREEIIVVGRRLPGSLPGDVPSDLELDADEVASLGATDLAELLNELEAQTRGAGGEAPVVTVNGRRISNFSDIADLPPEALARVEVYPEGTGRRLGLGGDQRVVNLVLRSQHRSFIVEGEAGFATEGGRSLYEAAARYANISGDRRTNASLRYQGNTMLLESEREIAEGLGTARSLTPAVSAVIINGSARRNVLSDVVATLNGRANLTTNKSRIGLRNDALSGNALEPLLRSSEAQAFEAGLTLEGNLANTWEWTFIGDIDFQRDVDVADTRAGLFNEEISGQQQTLTTSTQTLRFEGLVDGSLASLPAGDLSATFSAEYERSRLTSRNSNSLDGATLSRDIRGARVVFTAPLFRREVADVGLGNLSANLNAGLQEASDFGSLTSFGYGLNWVPFRGLSIVGSFSDELRAPTIRRLGLASILIPNVRVFDFLLGETVEVASIEGGNPSLLAENAQTLRLGVSLRPIRDASLTVVGNYLHRRMQNGTASFPTATPEAELAFPERFLRNAEGRLLRVDARPVNLAEATREEVRWGINFSQAFGSSAGSRNGTGVADPEGTEPDENSSASSVSLVRFALYHTLLLQDRARIRSELPELNFLAGTPTGSGAGRPRHSVQFQSGLYGKGLGLRLDGNWESSTRVRQRSQDGDGAEDLLFSSKFTLDVRAFANFAKGNSWSQFVPWLTGTRVTVSIDNILNSRPRVRNSAELTPVAYQSAYLDPIGRTVRIALRKLF